MKRYIFDGREPIKCLQFLSTFVRKFNNGISEGAAVSRRARRFLIWPNFLLYDALESFRIHSEDGEDDHGGFTAWPMLSNTSCVRTPNIPTSNGRSVT